MSGVTLGGEPLNLGEDAADVFRKTIRILVDNLDDGVPEALEKTESTLKTELNGKKKKLLTTLIKSLQTFLGRHGLEAFSDFVITLEDLQKRTERDYLQDGKIDFGELNWTGEQSTGNEKFPVSLSIEAATELYFQVLKSDEKPPAPADNLSQTGLATGALTLKGKAAAGAFVKPGITDGLASISLKGSLDRRLTYYSSYNSLSRYGGLALADALGHVANPGDLDGVAKAFATPLQPHAGKLKAIEYVGSQSIGADADIKLTINTGSGLVSFTLGGSASFGRGFKIVTFKQSQTSAEIVSVIKDTTNTERGASFGMTYKLGLDDIKAGMAKKILGKIVKADELIETLDDDLGDALDFEKWLKPGSLVQSELEELIKGLLKTSSNSGESDKEAAELSLPAFAAMFGLNQSLSQNAAINDVANRASTLFAGLVDQLFDPQGTQEKLKEDITTALKTGFDDKVLAKISEKVLDKIPDLGEKLEEAANTLNAKSVAELQKALDRAGVTDKVELFRSYLSKARGLLKDLMKKVELASTNLLSAEFSVYRNTAMEETLSIGLAFDPTEKNACEAFSKFISQRGKISDWLAPGVDIDGVRMVPEYGVTRVSEILTKAGTSWKLAFLDASLTSGSTMIARAKIEEDLNTGTLRAVTSLTVTAGTSIGAESRTSTFLSAMQLLYAQPVHEVKVANENAEDQWAIEKTAVSAPSFKITFEQNDNGLTGREIKEILSEFVAAGVLEEKRLSRMILARDVAADVDPDGKLAAEMGLGLEIPPGRINDLIKIGAAKRANLDAASRDAVAEYMDDTIAEYAYWVTAAMASGSFEDAVSSALVGRRVTVPSRITSGFVLENAERITKGVLKDLSGRRGALVTKYRSRVRFYGDELTGSCKAIGSTFSICQRVIDEFGPGVSVSDLRNEQDNIRKAIRPLLTPGYDEPDWARFLFKEENGPKRLVVLFKIICDFCEEELGFRPHAKLSLTVENGEPMVF